MKVMAGFKRWVPGARTLVILITLATALWSASLFADEVQLFLLAGQSNMVSRNLNADLPPPMDQPLPAVQIWRSTTKTWYDLQGGFGKTFSDFGPEVSFGHRLAEELSENLRIVKVADGGTTLAEDWNPETPSERQMYPLLLADVADAIDNLEAAGHTVKVAGMMWMQGESDTLHEWMANAYESNLTAFIARVRSDLATPNMPFILGRIHNKLMAQAPYVELVRTAQVNVAQGDPWADWIDTDTFSLQMDIIHYNSSGTIELGRAFAEAYLEMTGFKINPGLNDHWYNPATVGQGVYITVLPDLGKVTLTMFTYDTLLPPVEATANLGDPSQRWLNALGNYSGNQAVLNVSFDFDGIFDSSEETTKVRGYGTIILTFDSCNSGTIEYDIPSIDRTGIVPIQRIASDNIPLCEAFVSE